MCADGTDDASETPETPDEGREHIETLRETIDRNRNFDWEAYRERYRFTLVADGAVRVSRVDAEAAETASARAVEHGVDHVVTLASGRAVDCNCHVARRPVGQKSCRHMRAVESHPRL
ncbi:hypothetical protein [Halogranum rubrum]|uniref:SWIM-type domain-containing protein n=1 Tax=Halogranum salarium B-1 TaxID=1210908 RepID=J3A0C0_9EURY|nr:hypothetical protein [Halogranum salarium]EJN58773.1 hypothetical protein HSB1_28540 [Halogranum salarium B-1]